MLERWRLPRPLEGVLAVSLLIGAVFGISVGQSLATDCIPGPDIDVIEGHYAQDTDFDGIATVEEGMFDIDEDEVFGEAERQYFSMCTYIKWVDPSCVYPLPVFYAVHESTCIIDTTISPPVGGCWDSPDTRVKCIVQASNGHCVGTLFTPP